MTKLNLILSIVVGMITTPLVFLLFETSFGLIVVGGAMVGTCCGVVSTIRFKEAK